ncbi:MAG: DUF29 domain-containing protein [Desulfamplus sp.]|nr:DUF29 domain-containing protein [Desulfamplus sp.]MBF0389106.1 DUF29 domain-containing protein [Desulfamplus sp.]
MLIAYEDDIIEWSKEQANLLRSGNLSAIDIEHIAEEIEDVGKSEQRELANRMVVLMTHLLKWHFQPARQGSSWERTIKEQRNSILRRLKNTPSLKKSLTDEEWLADIWLDARLAAEKETQIDFDKFPNELMWKIDTILTDSWLPNTD